MSHCLHAEGESCVFCLTSEPTLEEVRGMGVPPLDFDFAKPSKKPTFERCADRTLEEVRAIYAERGAQYADTWSEENNVHAFTRDAYALINGLYPDAFSARDARILQLAALIDVKISRMTGGYRSDTVADLIAYLACYKTIREEYEAG